MIGPLAAGLALARPPMIDELRIPLTPVGEEPYVATVEVPRATETAWTSDADRFVCGAVTGAVTVTVAPGDWPSRIPKKLRCYGADQRKVTVPVSIDPSVLEAAFAGDGTLVLPRRPGGPALYGGAPPRDDLVVQQGIVTGFDGQCEIEQGPALRVVVPAAVEDGEGVCALRTRYGEAFELKLRLVTAR
jgi:hypothetical protein